MVAYLLWLFWCLATTNQPDTPLLFKCSNTRFGHHSNIYGPNNFSLYCTDLPRLERDLRTPFGGIKNSGYGKEGGKYVLDFFTEQKNVCIKYYG